MARRKRHFLPRATYHVMLRGNDGQPIFFSESDRYRLCLLLQEGVEKFGHRILSFCFMTNHIHLAIQVGEVGLSSIMQNLAFRYTRYINWKLKRIGHLFQGRFKSVLVDSDRYLKALIRYIHLNPVKAVMTARPEDYRWSSHRAYLRTDDYAWLMFDHVLGKFGDSVSEAIKQFQEYVLAGIGVEEEIDFEAGCVDGVLGDDDFIESTKMPLEVDYDLRAPSVKLEDLLQSAFHLYEVTEESLRMPGKSREQAHVRSILAAIVRSSHGVTLQDLSLYLGRDISTISKAGTLLLDKARQNPQLELELKQFKDTHLRIANAKLGQ